MKILRAALAGALILSGGCGQQPATPIPFQGARSAPQVQDHIAAPLFGGGKITHVVIIFQENRSVDNLFNGLPGADTVRRGVNSRGQFVQLQPVLLNAPYDISHKFGAFKKEYRGGALNGFNLVETNCRRGFHCRAPDIRAYGYVPQREVEPYFAMAGSYAFADRMFQTNEGPSFPAHQYILSGTSTIHDDSDIRAAENAYTKRHKVAGGCDSPRGSSVWTIDAAGDEYRKVYPCFERQSLIDLVNAKQGLAWHYYQAHLGPGLWNGPDAIRQVRNSPQYAYDVVAPPSQVLTDIAAGNLANVVWVTPTSDASDHAGLTDGSGPSWVASVVNAIGTSKYWDDTAILITWDDWGGWYDHVKPPRYNSYELGFRVPLIVISAYTPKGYVSHRLHEFGSILKFTEKTFDLGSLGTTDVRADDLSDCFNFSRKPRTFQVIPATLPPSYFLSRPPSGVDPDDDF